MKAKILLIPVMLIASSLVACNNSEKAVGNLTFGLFSKAEAAADRLTSLTYEGLTSKLKDNKESLLLATYKGKGCTCWPTFQAQAKLYNEKWHARFYIIKDSEFTGKSDTFDLRIPESDTVTLAIFREGKLAKQWVESSETKQIFENYEEMHNAVSKVIGDPLYTYADESGLDYLIANKTSLSIYFAKSSCPDCTALETELLFPYAKDNKLKSDFYIFDVATYLDSEGNPGPRYQEIKDKYGLSTKNNPTLGFSTGVMPTLQFVENKTIKDMAVIYNDTLALDANEKYTVSDSYYDENRYQNLAFMQNVEIKVIKGKEVPESEVTPYVFPGGVYYLWSREGQNKYHKPIFNAFMNKYVKA